MAGKALEIFTTKYISPKEYSEFIEGIGGVLKDRNKCIGYIKKYNGIVLFNGYDDVDFFEQEKNIIEKRYNLSMEYTYGLEANTSGERESGYLLLYVCKEFMERWKDSIICNEYGGFFNCDDIVNETDYESWLYKSEE
ncbi:hypothetical protein NNC19_09560 [Clostridium sp. SHJSY1]|uniref:hypothetical protein n=1 Tax=Clostridium sp. SHJSY1 TaxID=2942483 RepID=UPI002876AEF1|nr:hypothetical protein [Clostridium sp. SHJSY1]MDS0525923.1 hypothetical protein [Clostridium sp. SHJSY1]